MPAKWVIDESKWARAKKKASEEDHAEDWAYITEIYKRMGGRIKKSDLKKSIRLKNSIMSASVQELLKAKAAQVGEVRHRKSGPHQKIAKKIWIPVKQVNGRWVAKRKKDEGKELPVAKVQGQEAKGEGESGQSKKKADSTKKDKEVGKKALDKPESDSGRGLDYVSVEDIRAEKQVREGVNRDHVVNLAKQIYHDGLLQPILLRPDPKNKGKYIVIAGEHRFRAIKALYRGGHWPRMKSKFNLGENGKLAAVVKNVTNKDEIHRLQLMENVSRQDMTPMETAKGMEKLVTEAVARARAEGQDNPESVGMKRAVSASGRSAQYINDYLKLNKLDPKVQKLVNQGHVKKGHAIEMAEMTAPEQLKWARTIIERKLNVKEFRRELRIKEAEKQNQEFFSLEEGMSPEQLAAHKELKELNAEPEKLRSRFQQFFDKQIAFVNSFLDDDAGLSALGLAASGHLDVSLKNIEMLQGMLDQLQSKFKHKRYELNAPGLFKSLEKSRNETEALERSYRMYLKHYRHRGGRKMRRNHKIMVPAYMSLTKSKAAIGEVHTWNGKDFRKVSEGQWVPVTGGKQGAADAPQGQKKQGGPDDSPQQDAYTGDGKPGKITQKKKQSIRELYSDMNRIGTKAFDMIRDPEKYNDPEESGLSHQEFSHVLTYLQERRSKQAETDDEIQLNMNKKEIEKHIKNPSKYNDPKKTGYTDKEYVESLKDGLVWFEE